MKSRLSNYTEVKVTVGARQVDSGAASAPESQLFADQLRHASGLNFSEAFGPPKPFTGRIDIVNAVARHTNDAVARTWGHKTSISALLTKERDGGQSERKSQVQNT